MPKKRKPSARDTKKEAANSVSGPKIELSLGEKLKAAGIVGTVPDGEDAAVHRVDSESLRGRNNKSMAEERSVDRDELNRAYLGVKRLRGRTNKFVRHHEAGIDMFGSDYKQPDARLAGTHEVNLLGVPGFDISWDRDGDVTGLRRDFVIDDLKPLFDSRFRPEAILDLHGTVAADLDQKVARFVTIQRRRGVRRLLFVHGKGKHSEDGVAVLGDRLIKVLSRGRVSRYVQGFCTASLEHGGTGALAVMLTK